MFVRWPELLPELQAIVRTCLCDSSARCMAMTCTTERALLDGKRVPLLDALAMEGDECMFARCRGPGHSYHPIDSLESAHERWHRLFHTAIVNGRWPTALCLALLLKADNPATCCLVLCIEHGQWRLLEFFARNHTARAARFTTGQGAFMPLFNTPHLVERYPDYCRQMDYPNCSFYERWRAAVHASDVSGMGGVIRGLGYR